MLNSNIQILHPDLIPFSQKGKMFDAKNEELEKNLGRKVKFINPRCGVEYEVFMLRHLQKNYKGEVIYRGYTENDSFGRPIQPDAIYFI